MEWLKIPDFLRNQRNLAVEKCEHVWISNSGRGGEPVFKVRSHFLKSKPIMHVRCEKCGDRTWLNKKQWLALTPK